MYNQFLILQSMQIKNENISNGIKNSFHMNTDDKEEMP